MRNPPYLVSWLQGAIRDDEKTITELRLELAAERESFTALGRSFDKMRERTLQAEAEVERLTWMLHEALTVMVDTNVWWDVDDELERRYSERGGG